MAMNKTKSVRAAARYLNVSYIHMKKWMKLYQNEDGITLFDAHKKQSGKVVTAASSTPRIAILANKFRLDFETVKIVFK